MNKNVGKDKLRLVKVVTYDAYASKFLSVIGACSIMLMMFLLVATINTALYGGTLVSSNFVLLFGFVFLFLFFWIFFKVRSRNVVWEEKDEKE